MWKLTWSGLSTINLGHLSMILTMVYRTILVCNFWQVDETATNRTASIQIKHGPRRPWRLGYP
jgi:hypothetical protein